MESWQDSLMVGGSGGRGEELTRGWWEGNLRQAVRPLSKPNMAEHTAGTSFPDKTRTPVAAGKASGE